MSRLYDISKDYIALTELEDVPADAIANTLELIKDDFDNKAVAMVKVTMNFHGEVLQIDEEVNRLLAQKAKRVNAINRLRDYLQTNMEATGINKIDHPLFTITLQKSRPMLVVVDQNDIPDEYMEIDVVQKPDKRRLLEELKKGTVIPGVEIGQSARALTIK